MDGQHAYRPGRIVLRFGVCLATVWFGMSGGCATGPRTLRDLDHNAGVFRARAVDLTRSAPTRNVIPLLLERLDDPDPVVRMTVHEELKQRTGMDLGFKPWDDAAERTHAVLRWKTWWQSQNPALPKPTPTPKSRQQP